MVVSYQLSAKSCEVIHKALKSNQVFVSNSHWIKF